MKGMERLAQIAPEQQEAVVDSLASKLTLNLLLDPGTIVTRSLHLPVEEKMTFSVCRAPRELSVTKSGRSIRPRGKLTVGSEGPQTGPRQKNPAEAGFWVLQP
jgi:hypothetical protein